MPIAFPDIVQTVTHECNGNKTISVPSKASSGDLLIATMSCKNLSPTQSFARPSGWDHVFNIENNKPLALMVSKKVITSTSGIHTFTTTNNDWLLTVMVVKDWDSTETFQKGFASSTSGTPLCPGMAGTWHHKGIRLFTFQSWDGEGDISRDDYYQVLRHDKLKWTPIIGPRASDS